MKWLLVIVALVLVSTASAQLADAPWPTFNGDSQRTGLSEYDTSHVDGTVLWIFQAGSIDTSPAIGPNDDIYFGSHDGYFYKLNKDGELVWKTKIGTPILKEFGDSKSYTSTSASPAIAKDGTIYTASRDQFLFAIDSSGNIKWKFPIGVSMDAWNSPAIGSDGTIYTMSSKPDAGIYAINPDGTEK